MTGADAIDQLLAYGDNASPTDADNSDRRERARLALQETKDYVIWYRMWSFLYASGTVVMATTGQKVLPSDFGSIPSWGGVFDSTTGVRIPPMNQQEVMYAQTHATATDTIPRGFAIFGIDASGVPYLQTPKLAAERTLVVKYLALSTTIVDSDSNSKLEQIPARWHQIVLIPGARRFMQHSKGDARTVDYSAQFQQGLLQMVREEPRGRDGTPSLPSFFGAR